METTAAVFTGQGAQSVGMGADVASAFPAVATLYERASAVVGFDLASCCFDGPGERLEQTDVQQPAIFVTSAAIWQAWLIAGGDRSSIQFMGGLSLGEYAALYAAEAVGFEDAVRLVHGRGRLMQAASEMTPGGMVTLIGADESAAEELCAAARSTGEVLAPANFNCPGQIVISGHRNSCARALELASGMGCRAVSLPVAGAFHSSLMQSAADGLATLLDQVEFSVPRVPVVTNVDGSYHSEPTSIRRYLCRQVTEPVRWQACVERVLRDGAKQVLEFGPGRILTNMMRKIDKRINAVNISTLDSVGSAPAASQSE